MGSRHRRRRVGRSQQAFPAERAALTELLVGWVNTGPPRQNRRPLLGMQDVFVDEVLPGVSVTYFADEATGILLECCGSGSGRGRRDSCGVSTNPGAGATSRCWGPGHALHPRRRAAPTRPPVSPKLPKPAGDRGARRRRRGAWCRRGPRRRASSVGDACPFPSSDEHECCATGRSTDHPGP